MRFKASEIDVAAEPCHFAHELAAETIGGAHGVVEIVPREGGADEGLERFALGRDHRGRGAVLVDTVYGAPGQPVFEVDAAVFIHPEATAQGEAELFAGVGGGILVVSDGGEDVKAD